ncbi:MAG TPA: hypothetical protein PKY77_05475 [Phycisphaerae bacterium]|nr:hypothetical protein [Phycisphaerae bacterium]HRY68964.1 hypothetical protein [Phycisphaerae bacterium]HSA25791.1 hypothetical protein [Phycisphaerae bacterium]
MAGVEENRRQRTALILVLFGAGLIILGFILSLRQQEEMETVTKPVTTMSAEQRSSWAQAIRQFLFLMLVILGVFSVGTLAFLRWSRRFRQWLLRKPPAATPNGDVWAMHRLPEEESEESPPEEPPPGTQE